MIVSGQAGGKHIYFSRRCDYVLHKSVCMSYYCTEAGDVQIEGHFGATDLFFDASSIGDSHLS